jgi:hypothetical protein
MGQFKRHYWRFNFVVDFSIEVLRQRWYWLNSVVAFISAYILWRFHVSGWQYLMKVFLLPGRLFSIYTPWSYLTDGLVMLTLGLLLLVSTVSINFINANLGAKATRKPQER